MGGYSVGIQNRIKAVDAEQKRELVALAVGVDEAGGEGVAGECEAGEGGGGAGGGVAAEGADDSGGGDGDLFTAEEFKGYRADMGVAVG